MRVPLRQQLFPRAQAWRRLGASIPSRLLFLGLAVNTGAAAKITLASLAAISSAGSAGSYARRGDQRSCTRGPRGHQAGSKLIGPI